MRLLYKDHPDLYKFLCSCSWFEKHIDVGVDTNNSGVRFIRADGLYVPANRRFSFVVFEDFTEFLKERYPEVFL